MFLKRQIFPITAEEQRQRLNRSFGFIDAFLLCRDSLSLPPSLSLSSGDRWADPTGADDFRPQRCRLWREGQTGEDVAPPPRTPLRLSLPVCCSSGYLSTDAPIKTLLQFYGLRCSNVCTGHFLFDNELKVEVIWGLSKRTACLNHCWFWWCCWGKLTPPWKRMLGREPASLFFSWLTLQARIRTSPWLPCMTATETSTEPSTCCSRATLTP